MSTQRHTNKIQDRFYGQGRRFIAAASFMAVLGLLAVGLPALAQGDDDGKVAVGGKMILTIRTAAEGMTIRQRADAVQDRLVLILADPDLRPSDIMAVPLGRNAAKIMVKNRLLVTVDADTAKINQAKPLALAQIWVRHLRRVLPQVNQKPNPNEGAPEHDTTTPPPSK